MYPNGLYISSTVRQAWAADLVHTVTAHLHEMYARSPWVQPRFGWFRGPPRCSPRRRPRSGCSLGLARCMQPQVLMGCGGGEGMTHWLRSRGVVVTGGLSLSLSHCAWVFFTIRVIGLLRRAAAPADADRIRQVKFCPCNARSSGDLLGEEGCGWDGRLSWPAILPPVEDNDEGPDNDGGPSPRRAGRCDSRRRAGGAPPIVQGLRGRGPGG